MFLPFIGVLSLSNLFTHLHGAFNPAIYSIYKGFKSNNVDESRNGKLLMRIAKDTTARAIEIVMIAMNR